MRRHGREQDQAGRRQHGARQRRGRARGPVPEALAEEGDPDHRRHHRVDHRHGGQRYGQPRAPVGRLREQQSARRQYGDHRQGGPRGARGPGGAERVGDPLGDRLGEHRGHAERGAGRRRKQHAAQHRPVHPVRRQEQDGHAGRRRHQQQCLFAARQRPASAAVPARQGQQPRQAHRGHDGAPPGRRTRPPVYEHGGHGQREDDRERAQRLDQAQRTVRERHHVQQGAEAVQPDRDPPAGPAQRRVRAVRGAGRDPLLDDRAARVRHGGHQAQQDRQHKGTHRFHNALPKRPIPPPQGRIRSSSRHTPSGVEDPAPSSSRSASRDPAVAVCEVAERVWSRARRIRTVAVLGTSAAGGRGRVIKERQRP